MYWLDGGSSTPRILQEAPLALLADIGIKQKIGCAYCSIDWDDLQADLEQDG
jgi:hypothetical protein